MKAEICTCINGIRSDGDKLLVPHESFSCMLFLEFVTRINREKKGKDRVMFDIREGRVMGKEDGDVFSVTFIDCNPEILDDAMNYINANLPIEAK